jgi:MFS family permease
LADVLAVQRTDCAVVVGVAWTLPTVLFLLVGGAVTDRLERRRVLLIANLAEAVAIGLIGVLAVVGVLTLLMLLALVAVYGAGEAFFNPAFEAIVPTLVAPEELVSASALDHFVRPLALQLLGPAIGGVLVALAGAGANSWLWGTLAAASLSLLAYFGPIQVLLPFLVKNDLHAGGATFGAIRAAGGASAIVAAFAVAQTAGLADRRRVWDGRARDLGSADEDARSKPPARTRLEL